MTSVLIHQPEYLPWTHLFEKISLSDNFVFLDKVQYSRRSFQNRNKIKTINGERWLTVPVKYSNRNELISNIKIDNSKKWQFEHLSLIKNNYEKSKFFSKFYSELENIISQDFLYLSQLNTKLIIKISELLNLKCNFLYQSELNILTKKSNLILDICKSLNTKEYVTGTGSKNYLKVENFKKNNIDILFVEPKNLIYTQQHYNINFISNLSIIDMIFNEGYDLKF